MGLGWLKAPIVQCPKTACVAPQLLTYGALNAFLRTVRQKRAGFWGTPPVKRLNYGYNGARLIFQIVRNGPAQFDFFFLIRGSLKQKPDAFDRP